MYVNVPLIRVAAWQSRRVRERYVNVPLVRVRASRRVAYVSVPLIRVETWGSVAYVNVPLIRVETWGSVAYVNVPLICVARGGRGYFTTVWQPSAMPTDEPSVAASKAVQLVGQAMIFVGTAEVGSTS